MRTVFCKGLRGLEPVDTARSGVPHIPDDIQ